MKKFIIILFFNALAIYFILIYLAGKGGMIENINKYYTLKKYEIELLKEKIILENYRSMLLSLKNADINDNSFIANQGKKINNTIIFKYKGKDKVVNLENKEKDYMILKIIFYFLIAIFIIIIGNILIILNFTKRERGFNENLFSRV